jgi:hypothetical protein
MGRPHAGGDAARPRVSRVSETLAYDADLLESADAPARTLVVTLIRAGLSKNNRDYPREVLEAAVAARLFEGATCCIDHPAAMTGRSLRDVAGVYTGARLEGDAVRAELTFYPAHAWAYDLAAQVVADRAAGRPTPDVGLSGFFRIKQSPPCEARSHWSVTEIRQVFSVDLVAHPAAGGTFDATSEQIDEEIIEMPIESMESIADVPTDPATEQGEAARVPTATEPPDDAPPALASASPALDALLAEAEERMATIRVAEEQALSRLVEARLAAARLPGPALDLVRRRISAGPVSLDLVDRAVAEATDLLAALVGVQTVQGMGPARGSATTRSPIERVQVALDRLFGLPVADADRDVPALTGIREAYVSITGDKRIAGVLAPEDSVLEANEVTTGVLANVLANSMTKRVIADYAAQPKWWQPLVIRTVISDFKQQQRIHLNDFASLSTVAENAAYTNLAWGDTRETYTPAKRGNLVVVTLESIRNDDLYAIRRIPTKLAAAAVATINDFVASLFTANGGAGALLADASPVFDAANHQGNAVAGAGGALSSATLQTALVTLLKMTNSAGKRLGVQGKYLLVPPDLFYTARVLLESANLPGGANNDVNPVKGALEPISVPSFSDSNNWYVLAEPGQIEMIELGFLDGREVPELIAQSSPDVGSVFTNDALAWKVRHVFGGTFLDYRGGYGAIVP